MNTKIHELLLCIQYYFKIKIVVMIHKYLNSDNSILQMDIKRTIKQSKRSLDKSNASNSNRKKRPTSSTKKSKPKDVHHFSSNNNIAQSFANDKKKKCKTMLVKKKIQDIKAPDLIIKISYKGKKLSIPLNNIENKGLQEIMTPYIVRFEREILKNPEFTAKMIEAWKTISPGDILKDYYFQTGKPIDVFKGQLLQIEPIFAQKLCKTLPLNPSPMSENLPYSQKIKLSDFQIIKCIGTGGFSKVFLSRYCHTGKFYALKLMEKQGLLETGKQCVVINQRDLMVDLDHKYILKLEYAFQTKHFVVLALQYCPGGELFYYLRKVKRMTEDEARYCFVEILMGIQYLHSKKIIYRDIKPENIMIDMNGNLKIADFGLSKKGIRPSELAYTFCGSPQYMAPQMLAKSGHTYSVDYYCLGALLYELVTGSPPFYSRDVQKIYYCIQNQQIEFPTHVQLSPQIKMLLEGLLIKDPKRRLGSLGGIREILGHPWVRKIKPQDIENQIVQTPIKIDLMEFNINEQQIEEAQGDFSAKFRDEDQNFQEMFEDFYFNRNETFSILEEALPSVKSDSTKQNRSLNQKNKNSKQKEKPNFKSSLSRQNHHGYSLNFKQEQGNNHKNHSENRLTRQPIMQLNKKSSGSNLLGRKNSKKKIDLVNKVRQRNQKSLTKKGKKSKDRLLSPKPSNMNIQSQLNKSALKRIKSSAALHQKMQQKHNNKAF